MLSPEDALQSVLDAAEPLPAQPVCPDDACGLLLAEDVCADRDYPSFRRAMMDGYAVRTSDAGKTVAIAGEIAAGQASDLEVRQGTCVAIMTGAVCPAGTEAVVQKEHVRREGNRVQLPEPIAPGNHIAPVGSECEAARVVLHSGDAITPLAVAVMASFGVEMVRVKPRPAMAVITTGAELIPTGQKPQIHQIRDSNGPMLAAMARQIGLEQPLRLHVDDRLEAILSALEQSADRDVVLLTGGVSAGDYDLVPEALERFGAETLFHKVKQKPGKPLLLARKERQLIFGLPGNPLACHLGFSRYVAAAVRVMQGLPPLVQPLQARLTGPVSYRGNRTFFGLARAERVPGVCGAWCVVPLSGVSSADIFTPCGANCYITVPPGVTEIPASELVPFTWIPGYAE
jgi:molybdopterin molybdotransferase